jgi:hypothetical protein
MRTLITALLSVAMLSVVAVGPASAAGHQFRGHVVTTATVGGPTDPVLLEGRGVISGLGASTMSGSELVDPVDGSITGSATFVAASGDQITFSWTDIPVAGAPPVITFAGPMTVTGATGRLAGRGGTVSFSGMFDFRTGQGSFDVSGSIGG